MGFNLSTTTETFVNVDNHEWLASAHGLDDCDSVTLDATSALNAFPSGDVPAGVEISRDPDNGRYIIGIRAAATGVTASDRPGFLAFAVKVVSGVNSVGALLWHGEVIAAKVPLGAGGTAPVQANHPLIRLV